MINSYQFLTQQSIKHNSIDNEPHTNFIFFKTEVNNKDMSYDYQSDNDEGLQRKHFKYY